MRLLPERVVSAGSDVGCLGIREPGSRRRSRYADQRSRNDAGDASGEIDSVVSTRQVETAGETALYTGRCASGLQAATSAMDRRGASLTRSNRPAATFGGVALRRLIGRSPACESEMRVRIPPRSGALLAAPSPRHQSFTRDRGLSEEMR